MPETNINNLKSEKKIDFSKFLDNDMTGIFGDIYKLCKDYAR